MRHGRTRPPLSPTNGTQQTPQSSLVGPPQSPQRSRTLLRRGIPPNAPQPSSHMQTLIECLGHSLPGVAHMPGALASWRGTHAWGIRFLAWNTCLEHSLPGVEHMPGAFASWRGNMSRACASWQQAGSVLAACWQHAVSMLAACWQHAGSILAAFWQRPGSMLAACWQHAGSVLAASWQHAGSVLAECWQHAGSMLAASWQRPGSVLAACWQRSGSVLAASWQHTNNMLAASWQRPGGVLAACWQRSGSVLAAPWQHAGMAACWQRAGSVLAACWQHAGSMLAAFLSEHALNLPHQYAHGRTRTTSQPSSQANSKYHLIVSFIVSKGSAPARLQPLQTPYGRTRAHALGMRAHMPSYAATASMKHAQHVQTISSRWCKSVMQKHALGMIPFIGPKSGRASAGRPGDIHCECLGSVPRTCVQKLGSRIGPRGRLYLGVAGLRAMVSQWQRGGSRSPPSDTACVCVLDTCLRRRGLPRRSKDQCILEQVLHL